MSCVRWNAIVCDHCNNICWTETHRSIRYHRLFPHPFEYIDVLLNNTLDRGETTLVYAIDLYDSPLIYLYILVLCTFFRSFQSSHSIQYAMCVVCTVFLTAMKCEIQQCCSTPTILTKGPKRSKLDQSARFTYISFIGNWNVFVCLIFHSFNSLPTNVY